MRKLLRSLLNLLLFALAVFIGLIAGVGVARIFDNSTNLLVWYALPRAIQSETTLTVYSALSLLLMMISMGIFSGAGFSKLLDLLDRRRVRRNQLRILTEARAMVRNIRPRIVWLARAIYRKLRRPYLLIKAWRLRRRIEKLESRAAEEAAAQAAAATERRSRLQAEVRAERARTPKQPETQTEPQSDNSPTNPFPKGLFLFWGVGAVTLSGLCVAAYFFLPRVAIEVPYGKIIAITLATLVVGGIGYGLYLAAKSARPNLKIGKMSWALLRRSWANVVVGLFIIWIGLTIFVGIRSLMSSPASSSSCIILEKKEQTIKVVAKPGEWSPCYTMPFNMQFSWTAARETARYKMRVQGGSEYSFTPELSEPVRGYVRDARFMALGTEEEEIVLTLEFKKESQSPSPKPDEANPPKAEPPSEPGPEPKLKEPLPARPMVKPKYLPASLQSKGAPSVTERLFPFLNFFRPE